MSQSAEARYAFKALWVKPDSWTERGPLAAVVTAKRVTVGIDKYDRVTGHYIGGRFAYGTKPRCLLAYRVAGGVWITLDSVADLNARATLARLDATNA